MNQLYLWIDRAWQWIAERIFVRFQFEISLDSIRAEDPNAMPVFALTRGGVIEWLILSSWCRSQGLPAILVANRKRVLLFSKPLYFLQILFRQRSYADLFLLDKEKGPRLIFCSGNERKKLFVPTRLEKLLSTLQLRATQSTLVTQFRFVPVLVTWRKHIRAEWWNIREFILGLSSDPNLIGKMIYLLLKRNDSRVRALGILRLGEKDTGDIITQEEGDAMWIAKTLRRRIIVLDNQERRVTLGPRYYSPYSVKESIIREPDLQNLIDEITEKSGTNRKKLMSQAYQNLTEIVANYQFRFIELMYVFLSWLFTKVFDGLQTREEQFTHLREVAKNKQVIYIPCHRSHLDYLVIPYVLFVRDMVTPHIAAGINLAFWPVGYFLRMGGAFFIRRSFRGDPLYALCLKKYVEFLIKNRHNMKFFIEGTRSRSGKMLPPAYGILKMILETYQRKVIDDIALVPVSICYDEVPEQGSYSKEISGGQKAKENAVALLKSRRLIRRNFGKVYLNLAPEIYVKEIMGSDAASLDSGLVLQKTAFQICKRINDATPITPKSLVCSLMLSHYVGSLSLEDVLRLSEAYADYVSASGGCLSVEYSQFRRSIEQTLRTLVKGSYLNVTEGVPREFFCENRKRTVLNYYKNNAIHCLIIPAIASTALFVALIRDESEGPVNEQIRTVALSLRNLFKFEFFFSPSQRFIEEIESFILFWTGQKHFSEINRVNICEALESKFSDTNDLSIYSRLIGELIEAYQTVVRYFEIYPTVDGEKKAIVQRIVKFAESRSLANEFSFPESFSVQTYTTALSVLENLKLVKVENQNGKTMLSAKLNPGDLDVLMAPLDEYFAAIRTEPEKILHPSNRMFIK